MNASQHWPSSISVGEEVAARFDEAFVDRSGAKPHVDLGLALASQLTEAGLLTEHITQPPACSPCNSEDFFSARRLGICLVVPRDAFLYIPSVQSRLLHNLVERCSHSDELFFCHAAI